MHSKQPATGQNNFGWCAASCVRGSGKRCGLVICGAGHIFFGLAGALHQVKGGGLSKDIEPVSSNPSKILVSSHWQCPLQCYFASII